MKPGTFYFILVFFHINIGARMVFFNGNGFQKYAGNYPMERGCRRGDGAGFLVNWSDALKIGGRQ